MWPCARVLASYVFSQRSFLSGVRVLEIGAGTGLPGLLAAKLGADVTLADHDVNDEALEVCRRSCVANGFSPYTRDSDTGTKAGRLVLYVEA